MKSFSVDAIFVIFLILALLPSDIDAKQHKKAKQHNQHNQHNQAMLTINSFEKGGDGGGASECDGRFHSDNKLIVALSSRWYNRGSRCHHFITITAGNGRKVRAQVVDECDSKRGCANNIVDASQAVWKALGVPKKNWGLMKVTWSDA